MLQSRVQIVWHPKEHTMSWETPSFEEINMSAEIGSYYEDFDGL